MSSDDELWAKLEEKGEEAVRVELAKGVYGSVGGKRQLVEEWIRAKVRSRSDRRDNRKKIIDTIAAIAAIVAAVAATIGAISSTIMLFSN